MCFPEHLHPNVPRFFSAAQTQFFSDPHLSLLSVPSPPAVRYWASIRNRFSSGTRASSPAGYEEMRKGGACACSNKGNPSRLGSAEERTPGSSAVEGEEGTRGPVARSLVSQALAHGSQPSAGRAPTLSPPRWARRAARTRSPGTRQAQAGRPGGAQGPNQSLASGPHSEAADVFAFGCSGAKPGRAVTSPHKSRDRHSNKQSPPQQRARAPPRPAPPACAEPQYKRSPPGRTRCERLRGSGRSASGRAVGRATRKPRRSRVPPNDPSLGPKAVWVWRKENRGRAFPRKPSPCCSLPGTKNTGRLARWGRWGRPWSWKWSPWTPEASGRC